ncbi:rRNA adenine N-6-methyltransferase family protein [Actinomadura sp. NEAU-AAG7]|uniref:rRNA adenine N-6-methyltransferase family protein n=1 Tax=Actinomadura sp. NEAU-AAG7 TaxID=2839640 RepID=UPI001BE3F383|nr:rRNA adenine N-6-methyltransferase family protein [Actinomadura sp. NEAU-AAG7]MBT2210477.1 methyltransferase domain-containing protein [Actinomadura sp. NEAU-AAG7]
MIASDALRKVRRELFIPETIWVPVEGTGWYRPLRRADDPAGWRAEVESDRSVITQVDDGATERGVWPTSSSSASHIMATMLDGLRILPGMRVLEIGTGTGYNAALLAEMAGAENVTTIEIDTSLAKHAQASLERAGYPVTVVSGDGVEGHWPGAPYDRIIVTAAVAEVPYAWVEQTRAGGIIIAPWVASFHPDEPLLTLEVKPDGTAEGRFGSPAWFMPMRGRRLPQHIIRATDERWAAAGRPEASRYGVTVTPETQTIWLDTPTNPQSEGMS